LVTRWVSHEEEVLAIEVAAKDVNSPEQT